MSGFASQISTSIDGLTRELDIITHNLANVSTAGYKRRCNAFSKSLSAKGVGTKAETGNTADLYAAFDFSQGSINETGRTLDFALCGKGFFVLETPDGPLYTRKGKFRVGQNGQLLDSAGKIVAGENGPIAIPPTVAVSQINVSTNGNITAAGMPIGKFKLVDFKDKEGELVSAGFNNFHDPNDLKPDPPENLIVKQGFQEGSNVQMVEELVDMIMVSRLYEANMKFMTTGKDLTKDLLGVALG